MKTWRFAAINFDHFHMLDNLRMAMEHPAVEVVALCDVEPSRMETAIEAFGFAADQIYTDCEKCLEEHDVDVVLLCPATADHQAWTERVARFGVHVLIEKPFAESTAAADAMQAAVHEAGTELAINWPMIWYPVHQTAKRLVDDGAIGTLREVHYYNGNRGPLWHGAGKVEKTADQVAQEKPESWFYQRKYGGGSLLDYLGYGTTLATWFFDGAVPREVTACVDQPEGLEVDEQSVVIARYDQGLSVFQTKWGTFTDPWTNQPQPKCGFILVGSEGTISSYDYEPTVRVQRASCRAGEEIPVVTLEPPHQNPVQYLIDRLERKEPVDGPMSPAVSRIGQLMVDAARQSAKEKRTVAVES